jgi:hypothetical protein
MADFVFDFFRLRVAAFAAFAAENGVCGEYRPNQLAIRRRADQCFDDWHLPKWNVLPRRLAPFG